MSVVRQLPKTPSISFLILHFFQRRELYEKYVPHISQDFAKIVDKSKNIEFKQRCKLLLKVNKIKTKFHAQVAQNVSGNLDIAQVAQMCPVNSDLYSKSWLDDSIGSIYYTFCPKISTEGNLRKLD
jgi:hypothetical protein